MWHNDSIAQNKTGNHTWINNRVSVDVDMHTTGNYIYFWQAWLSYVLLATNYLCETLTYFLEQRFLRSRISPQE